MAVDAYPHEYLEIKVVNRWQNRMIGDKPVKTGRYTYTPHDPFTPNMLLLPSGLSGLVRILSQQP